MKLIGILFVVISAASIGFRFSLAVRQRCDLLGQLLLALRLLKSELSSHGTPIPEAFGFAAAGTKGSAANYFSTAAKQMNQKRWLMPEKALELAAEELKELSADDPVKAVLRDFASCIGRFELESQLHGIDCAAARLEELRKLSEQEKTLRCKTYRTLGVCAGLALAILLV